jgi:site-specific DNA-methyltransferase (adenine-specific)
MNLSEARGLLPEDVANDNVRLMHGDCIELMRSMPENSGDLILTDPPYFKVKDEPWDNMWAKPDNFLAWLDGVLAQFQRILKPNGSLYLFASPQMAARVEVLIAGRFNVLNSIRWYKASGWHKKTRKEDLGSYLEPWEAVVFAEKFGADPYAPMARDVQIAQEPVRAYLAAEFARAGWGRDDLNRICGTASIAGGHFAARSQFQFPEPHHYAALQAAAPSGVLTRDYDELRAEYEMLCRSFSVTAETAHTDLWTFDPVRPYPGKHPCEKPAAMLEHIITASSRPGAVVFDAFAGSGSTAVAARNTGRKFIGCEMNSDYIRLAMDKLTAANDNERQPELF